VRREGRRGEERMKRIVVIVLALVLVMSLAATLPVMGAKGGG